MKKWSRGEERREGDGSSEAHSDGAEGQERGGQKKNEGGSGKKKKIIMEKEGMRPQL